jgi:lipoprotein signal peptidase
MAERSYRGLLWGLALLAAFADQGTKYGIFAALYNHGEGDSRPLIPGAFDLLVQFTGERETGSGVLPKLRTLFGDALPRVNSGALFGMRLTQILGLRDDGGRLDNQVFAAISLLAAGAILFWSTRPSLGRDRLLCTALGLILGGTLGNLYDRIVFNGVRDFLHWHYAFEWPVFNLADCCLVSGAILLLAQAVWARPVHASDQPIPAQEAVPAP